MTLEDFIDEYVVNADHDPCESDVDRVAREEDTAAALAELAELREQVKTARLEGAREAWRIARANVFAGVVEGDYCCCPPLYEDWEDANDAYRAAFGEEAP